MHLNTLECPLSNTKNKLGANKRTHIKANISKMKQKSLIIALHWFHYSRTIVGP